MRGLFFLLLWCVSPAMAGLDCPPAPQPPEALALCEAVRARLGQDADHRLEIPRAGPHLLEARLQANAPDAPLAPLLRQRIWDAAHSPASITQFADFLARTGAR